MPHRGAKAWTGSAWDDIGDSRLLTHNHNGGANGANIPQSAVTNLASDLGSKLDTTTAASTYLPIAGGKILQVRFSGGPSYSETFSTSFVDTNSGSVSITPLFSTSTLFLLVVGQMIMFQGGTSFIGGNLSVTDSSNTVISGFAPVFYVNNGASTAVAFSAKLSAASTSARTYKLRQRVVQGATAAIGIVAELIVIEVSQ
jgi:hypothetical protein